MSSKNSCTSRFLPCIVAWTELDHRGRQTVGLFISLAHAAPTILFAAHIFTPTEGGRQAPKKRESCMAGWRIRINYDSAGSGHETLRGLPLWNRCFARFHLAWRGETEKWYRRGFCLDSVNREEKRWENLSRIHSKVEKKLILFSQALILSSLLYVIRNFILIDTKSKTNLYVV